MQGKPSRSFEATSLNLSQPPAWWTVLLMTDLKHVGDSAISERHIQAARALGMRVCVRVRYL